MKKQIFWKVIISILVLALFLVIWMSRWKYEANGTRRINRITGEVYMYDFDVMDWKKWGEK